LWQRIDFNILISNTDDHLRNNAFLCTGRAGWRLSPANLALAGQSMIKQQEQLRFAGVVPQPYERLGAKLASLCRDQIHGSAKIRVIVAFSDYDAGRGSAILWLTKHFGVMPVELANQEGGLDLSELEALTYSGDQMLIIQTVPLNSSVLKTSFSGQDPTAGGKTSINDMLGLTRHIPSLKDVPDQIAEASANILVHHIESFGKYLSSIQSRCNLPVIYFAGFSVAEEMLQRGILPASKLIPWYLQLSGKNGIGRIYRQPELSQFLQTLPDKNPMMIDLESIISDLDLDTDLNSS
jgi:hypothetical protein